MRQIKINREQEKQLNHYVENHLSQCYSVLLDEDCDDSFQSFDVFCGCHTCVQRETLHAAFEYLRLNKILELTPDESDDN
jgi:hypothetical protein